MKKLKVDCTYISIDLQVGLCGAAAEIAEFPFVVDADEDIFRFDVPVRDRWLL